MIKITLFLISIFILSSCCTKVYFESGETFWSENYEVGDEIIFKSNRGDYDTLKITNIIHYKPTGDCNILVSNYDCEFVRIDYSIKKDTFLLETGWLVQHSAEPNDKSSIPVLRFLNMEYNESEGPLKIIKIDQGSNPNKEVFLFDNTNCGMHYNQKFGVINFLWSKEKGLIGYENSSGEKWEIEK